MPVIKSAIKKLRRDKKVTVANNVLRASANRALKLAKKQKTAKAISAAVSQIDKAVKKNLIHKNRAARIKSALSKLSKPASRTVSKPTATVKKTTQKIARKVVRTQKSKNSL